MHEKINKSGKMTKSKGAHTDGSSNLTPTPYISISIWKYFHRNMASGMNEVKTN